MGSLEDNEGAGGGIGIGTHGAEVDGAGLAGRGAAEGGRTLGFHVFSFAGAFQKTADFTGNVVYCGQRRGAVLRRETTGSDFNEYRGIEGLCVAYKRTKSTGCAQADGTELEETAQCELELCLKCRRKWATLKNMNSKGCFCRDGSGGRPARSKTGTA
jgi:hypothetical protein